MLYPLKFKKVFKERVWGGQYLIDPKIETRGQGLVSIPCTSESRQVPVPLSRLSKTPIGESWEICDHEEGVSIVINGALEGETITELMKRNLEALLGRNNIVQNMRFPLLIKLIDANDKLSVQVHPKDDYAYKHENEPGKTEMWYIISAKPGARLVYGLRNHITKEIFKKAIDNNRIEKTLNEVEVKRGDVFFIPAGMVHAIGEGIVIAEIQQNSNTTYRVYDWNRVGLDGKPRELHIEKALDVIDFDLKMENRKEKKKGKDNGGVKENDNWSKEEEVRSLNGASSRSTVLATCPYFTTELLEIEHIHYDSTDKKGFHVLIVIEGNFKIVYEADGKEGEEMIKKEETLLMPAGVGKYTIVGKGVIIKTYL